MNPKLLNITPELTERTAAKADTALALLRRIASEFSPATFANSLGAEDMVLTDLICRHQLPIEIFSLDTCGGACHLAQGQEGAGIGWDWPEPSGTAGFGLGGVKKRRRGVLEKNGAVLDETADDCAMFGTDQ